MPCNCVCDAQFFQIMLKLRGSTMMRPNHEFWCVCVCVRARRRHYYQKAMATMLSLEEKAGPWALNQTLS